MYPELKTRLMNSLKYELDYVKRNETDKDKKLDKMLQIKNMLILLTVYEEIEPEIAKAINELAQKKKFEEERWNMIANIVGKVKYQTEC